MAEYPQVNQVLLATLEVQKQQALALSRVFGWFLAVSDTLRKSPEFEERLKQHPYFDQGPEPELRTIDEMIQKLDALIRKLKD